MYPISLPTPESVAIDIATPLKINPDKINQYLTVKVGDEVTQESIIAEKKAKFGLGKNVIKSPVKGFVAQINPENGTILLVNQIQAETPIIPNPEPEIKATPIQIIPEEAKPVFIRPSKNMRYNAIAALCGFGTAKGLGWAVEAKSLDQFLNADMQGRILITHTIPQLQQMYKASAIDISGIIAISDQVEEAKRLVLELNNKVHMGFLLIPEKTSVSKLHNKELQIKADSLELLIKKP
jgi:hypothetical protein